MHSTCEFLACSPAFVLFQTWTLEIYIYMSPCVVCSRPGYGDLLPGGGGVGPEVVLHAQDGDEAARGG